MKATAIALVLSAGMLAQGLAIGSQVKQQVQDIQSGRTLAYCQAGLQSACNDLTAARH